MPVVVKGEERDGGVDWYHEKDADDVFLFPGLQVMRGMHGHEEKGYEEGDDSKYRRDVETDGVEGVAIPDGFLRDGHILVGGIAFWPAHLEWLFGLRRLSTEESEPGSCSHRF